jgi:DNA polymerase-1
LTFRRNVNTDHKWLNIPDDELGLYNGWDCAATALCIAPMLKEMADQRMDEFWHREVWPLVPAVQAMQRRGLLVHQHTLDTYRDETRTELELIDKEILAADDSGILAKPTPKYANGLNAPQRVGKFLFDHCKLKPAKLTTKTGQPSVDQEALLKVWKGLRKKDEHIRPVIENLFHRSRLKTILTRYLSFETDDDGRLRPTIKMMAAKTMRFAYDNPALQQFPPEVRPVLGPAPGNVFVGADYEQLEARISALLAGVALDLDRFARGVDVHDETAMEVFGFELAEWEGLVASQRKAARDYAKSFRYRLAYGGDPSQVGQLGSRTFCPCHRCVEKVPPSLNLPAIKITEASQSFLFNRPEILSWREGLLREVKDTHALVTPLGYKRFIFDNPWRVKNEIYNIPIQTTASHIINRAMRLGHERYGAPYCLQMHDYLGVEVPEGEAELWATRLTEVMTEPVPEFDGYQFPVEVKVESPWGEPV